MFMSRNRLLAGSIVEGSIPRISDSKVNPLLESILKSETKATATNSTFEGTLTSNVCCVSSTMDTNVHEDAYAVSSCHEKPSKTCDDDETDSNDSDQFITSGPSSSQNRPGLAQRILSSKEIEGKTKPNFTTSPPIASANASTKLESFRRPQSQPQAPPQPRPQSSQSSPQKHHRPTTAGSARVRPGTAGVESRARGYGKGFDGVETHAAPGQQLEQPHSPPFQGLPGTAGSADVDYADDSFDDFRPSENNDCDDASSPEQKGTVQPISPSSETEGKQKTNPSCSISTSSVTSTKNEPMSLENQKLLQAGEGKSGDPNENSIFYSESAYGDKLNYVPIDFQGDANAFSSSLKSSSQPQPQLQPQPQPQQIRANQFQSIPVTNSTKVREESSRSIFATSGESSWELNYDDIEMLDKLGAGSYGTVYKGRLRHSQDYVAVKKFMDQSDDMLDLFKREIHILSSLRHEQIVVFRGACLDKDNLCLVMEYMSEGNMHQLIHRDEDISWKIRLRWVRDIARGMNYLHTLKPNPIIHRDLKSMNVLVNDYNMVKLCDFGMAKIKQASVMLTKSAGTPAWMAPECLGGDEITEKSDIYSFGVVMWEILTRQEPWEGLNQVQIYGKVIIKSETLPIPLNAPVSCPREYIKIMQSAWDVTPASRPRFNEMMSKFETMASGAKKLMRLY